MRLYLICLNDQLTTKPQTNKSVDFKSGVLIYKNDLEVPVCIVAGNGTKFYAIQNLKNI